MKRVKFEVELNTDESERASRHLQPGGGAPGCGYRVVGHGDWVGVCHEHARRNTRRTAFVHRVPHFWLLDDRQRRHGPAHHAVDGAESHRIRRASSIEL